MPLNHHTTTVISATVHSAIVRRQIFYLFQLLFFLFIYTIALFLVCPWSILQLIHSSTSCFHIINFSVFLFINFIAFWFQSLYFRIKF